MSSFLILFSPPSLRLLKSFAKLLKKHFWNELSVEILRFEEASQPTLTETHTGRRYLAMLFSYSRAQSPRRLKARHRIYVHSAPLFAICMSYALI